MSDTDRWLMVIHNDLEAVRITLAIIAGFVIIKWRRR